jgi:CheY-like chemotaxis protein
VIGQREQIVCEQFTDPPQQSLDFGISAPEPIGSKPNKQKKSTQIAMTDSLRWRINRSSIPRQDAERFEPQSAGTNPGTGRVWRGRNGRDGIDKALLLHPDLVVMDLIMPVMNGIEASRALKRLMPVTPLVMFTTFADPFLTKEAVAAGVDAVVPKSEGATALIRSIQTLIELPPPASAA